MGATGGCQTSLPFLRSSLMGEAGKADPSSGANGLKGA
jgi:hypothetical protein